MSRIFFNIPYRTDKNIGEAYNEFMRMLPSDEDYACFVDGDTIFLDSYFGKHIQEVIEKNPHIEYATCMTNRVACDWQVVPGIWEDDDLRKHKGLADDMAGFMGHEVQDMADGFPMSGVMILLKKSAWKKIGPFMDGMLGVDNEYHGRAASKGVRLWLMNGIYLYHWYRGGDRKNKKHLL